MDRLIKPSPNPEYQALVAQISNCIDNLLMSNEECLQLYQQLFADSAKNIPQLVLYSMWREAIEFVDGAQALIDKSCAHILPLIIRPLYEVNLGVKLILCDDEKRERRAVAYFVSHLNAIRDNIRKCTSQEPEYQKYRTRLRNEALRELYESSDLQHEDASVEELLSCSPLVQEVEKEYQRLMTKLNKPSPKSATGDRKLILPKWFSLFDGPPSLRKMSELLYTSKNVINAEYEPSRYMFYYDLLSSKSHVQNSLHCFSPKDLVNPKIPEKIYGSHIHEIFNLTDEIAYSVISRHSDLMYMYSIRRVTRELQLPILLDALKALTPTLYE